MIRLLRFLGWALRDSWARFQVREQLRGRAGVAPGVRIVSPHRLDVGEGVYLDQGAYLHCGDVEWCPDQGGIALGRGTYVGPQSILFGMGEIQIGSDVMISPNCVISSVQHPYDRTDVPMYRQPRVYGRVEIEDDVYLGSNVVVTPGVRIGRGAVVGAGAVVTRDIDPYTIALGVPARPASSRL